MRALCVVISHILMSVLYHIKPHFLQLRLKHPRFITFYKYCTACSKTSFLFLIELSISKQRGLDMLEILVKYIN